MATNLRGNIGRYVVANKTSIPSNLISAARRSIDARPFSSVSYYPYFAPRKGPVYGKAFLAGLLFSVEYWFDLTGLRAKFASMDAQKLSFKKSCAQDELLLLQREIDTIKAKPYERAHLNDSKPLAGQPAKSGE